MKKVGLLFGGIGNEAEVSIISAKNVAANFDVKKYELVLIYWHKDGHFYHVSDFSLKLKPSQLIREERLADLIDIALPMTHGRYGEDGILQSMFEKNKIKYCGCRVLSSALCMDKAVCKLFLSGHNVPQTKFQSINLRDFSKAELEGIFKLVKKELKFPLFVKPSNSGSSVGVIKVADYSQLAKAIKEANRHDHKIVIEEGLISPREIEVAVLGNGKLTVSRPGELILSKDFYDFDDKYKNNQTGMEIPAKLPAKVEREIINLAKKVYKLCDCRGLARIDFFYKAGKVYLNEVNTLPGFTQFSMYPMLMMKTGLSYKQLLNEIIKFAE